MSAIAGRYSSYHYTLSLLGPSGPATPLGGFSDASGLQEITGMHKVSYITLKRGVVDSSSLWNWISQVRSAGGASLRSVVVVLRDRSNNPVQSWKLRNATPKKYTGPPLGGKGNDVAMEELILSHEGLEILPAR